MPTLQRHTSFRPFLVALIGLAPLVSAQAPQTFTPKAIVQFSPGGDRERAVLSRMPGLAELIKGQFGLGSADLNGDGKAEIVVVSLACDGAGCPVVVIEDNAGRAAPIFARKVAGRLAITNEKLNGYYALAAADKAGAIIKDPGTGKQLIYVVGANAQGAAANAAPRTPPATRAVPPAPTPATAPRAPVATQQPAASQPVAQANGQFLPVCLLARCLNPRILSTSGVGTANAVAQAKVTQEDATAWCAQFNAGYKGCLEDQLAQGGTAGGAKFRANDFKATANCTTGKLTAVDGRSYTYVGTWAEGRGAGKPKFVGSMSEVGGRIFEQQPASGSTSIFQLALEPNAGESLAIQWQVLCAGAAPPK
ncbi:MAG: hypothetical protein ABI640_08395 [Gammaproteobacteria bacterium]